MNWGSMGQALDRRILLPVALKVNDDQFAVGLVTHVIAVGDFIAPVFQRNAKSGVATKLMILALNCEELFVIYH